jgi:hypothetical protein
VAAPRLDFPEAVRRLGGMKTGLSEGDDPGREGSVDAIAGQRTLSSLAMKTVHLKKLSFNYILNSIR